MEIESSFKNKSGQDLKLKYFENNPLENLKEKHLSVVHAFCFFGDKMVVVFAKTKGRWEPPGGGIENGETWQEATIREIKEESNMKVLHCELIGFQDVYEPNKISRQVRSFCVVEPYGTFISDPDGDITEIRLIDPLEYKKYFEWGIVGDRIMEVAMKKLSNFRIQNAS